MSADSGVDVAVDNDVMLKAVCYGLASLFWPTDESAVLGVLGAARYVVAGRLRRASLSRGVPAAEADLAALLATVETLEPSEVELQLAAHIELVAQRRGLFLDAGESQLVAMAIARSIPILETGDKRAIRSIDELLKEVDELKPVSGRVRCLEQIVLRLTMQDALFNTIATAVCAELRIDTTLTICFGCHSTPRACIEQVRQGLSSYIDALRAEAPRVLAP